VKPVPIRKLNKMQDFHGRLFHDESAAYSWLDRIQAKMGSRYTYGHQPWKAEDDTYLTLAYLHKGET
jgi:hypothetical protein